MATTKCAKMTLHQGHHGWTLEECNGAPSFPTRCIEEWHVSRTEARLAHTSAAARSKTLAVLGPAAWATMAYTTCTKGTVPGLLTLVLAHGEPRNEHEYSRLVAANAATLETLCWYPLSNALFIEAPVGADGLGLDLPRLAHLTMKLMPTTSMASNKWLPCHFGWHMPALVTLTLCSARPDLLNGREENVAKAVFEAYPTLPCVAFAKTLNAMPWKLVERRQVKCALC